MKKRLICLILALGILLSMGAGCEQKSDDEIVTLEYWFPISGMPPADLKEVNEYINSITREKIGVEVELKVIEVNSYENQMAIKINAADEFDICFTAEWCNSYIQNARKGAYLALDDLLEEYAPNIYNSVSQDLWDLATVNGSIYGIVNQQIQPRQGAVVVRKDMADAFGLDVDSIKTLEDLEPFLEFCQENSTADQIVGVFDMSGLSAYFGWDDFGRYDLPGVIQNTDGELKVYNQFESKEFQELMAIGKRWYEAGYFGNDILTAQPDYKTICVKFLSTYKPGVEEDEATSFGCEVIAIPLGESVRYTSWDLSTLNAISATSKHPEEALQFLDLLYSDPELFNALIYGIEGKHYNKTGENRVELIENSGYVISSGWEFGNQFNQWLMPTQPDDLWEQTKQINETADKSVAYGFVFDHANVRTEVANCRAVYEEYWMALLLGLFGEDSEAAYQEFLDKLETAGASKIIEEKQRQLDEWQAQNN